MAETLCQKRALEAFRLDPEKWGGKNFIDVITRWKFKEIVYVPARERNFGQGAFLVFDR